MVMSDWKKKKTPFANVQRWERKDGAWIEVTTLKENQFKSIVQSNIRGFKDKVDYGSNALNYARSYMSKH